MKTLHLSFCIPFSASMVWYILETSHSTLGSINMVENTLFKRDYKDLLAIASFFSFPFGFITPSFIGVPSYIYLINMEICMDQHFPMCTTCAIEIIDPYEYHFPIV